MCLSGFVCLFMYVCTVYADRYALTHIDTNAHAHSSSSYVHLHQNVIDTDRISHSRDDVRLLYCKLASLNYNWRTMHSYGQHKNEPISIPYILRVLLLKPADESPLNYY